eukprot:3798318-Pyramimonas_sp.AAC.1
MSAVSGHLVLRVNGKPRGPSTAAAELESIYARAAQVPGRSVPRQRQVVCLRVVDGGSCGASRAGAALRAS